MTGIRIVFCNAPDIDVAEEIANTLVKEQLAACVNILFPCRSIYQWNNQIENAQEIPMIIKTTDQAFDLLLQTVSRLHPYEVPEILAVDVADGLPGYCQWVHHQTEPSN